VTGTVPPPTISNVSTCRLGRIRDRASTKR
jgi:hypothetical protein